MLHLQNLKHVNLFHASVTAAATASGILDTRGYNEALIDVILDSVAAASNKPSVFNLQECDTTDGTFVDITGYKGGTDWTIPNAVTTGNQIIPLHIRTGNARKRYLKLSLSPATTQIVSATALLKRANQLPDTTTEQGVAAAVNG